jgi:hypothetical protein
MDVARGRSSALTACAYGWDDSDIRGRSDIRTFGDDRIFGHARGGGRPARTFHKRY